jgi:hypothetical protein
VNAKNGIATDEVIKEHAKVLGQQVNVTNFVHKVVCILLQKIRL